MKNVSWIIGCCVSMSLTVCAFAAEKQKPYPHYWMSIATSNQSVPGMSPEMGGMAAMFGGKKMFGPRRDLRLQLESPQVPAAAAQAVHEIPPGQHMGTSLPLQTPASEKSTHQTPERHERPETYEKPKVRMLMYWGCGETIAKGQPKVIDTAKMSPIDFGKAFAGRTPTRQTPPAPRTGWTYAEWPNKSDRTEIPDDSSLVGAHHVIGNYLPAINFSLDTMRDFMAPVELSPLQKTAGGALKIEWKSIPTAIGYFAAAIGHNQETGESIFWSASEVPETGFTLQDYLTTADVSRFIKDHVILPPAKTSCTIPPIFKQEQPGMLQFIAYGEELNLAHPPKPKDPKKQWDIQWSAKIRLKSTAMMPLMEGSDSDSPRKTSSSKKGKKQSETAEEQREEPGSQEEKPDAEQDSPMKGIGKGLRGIFGF
jgi:hypothetical protein